MNQFALGFMASRLFVHTSSPWKTRGCKCCREQIEGAGGAGLGSVHKKSPDQRTPLPAGDLGEAPRGWRRPRPRAVLAQRISPGRAAAASPGQGAEPARHARGWRGERGGGAPGGGEPRQQRCLSVIPANKILFHYPHYNWFTAFFVYLSIRAAVKWLGKAIA